MTHNLKRYRELSEPFPDKEALMAAFVAFWDDLDASRLKHKVADVHLVLQGNCLVGGEEETLIVCAHWGDSLKAEGMLAYAMGAQIAERESIIGRMLAQSARQRVKKEEH